MRNPRVLAYALATAISALVAGCGNNPAPTERTAANYRATHFAVTPVDQHLEIDGCTITVHRVTTGLTDPINDFTLAVAKCPTATVTTLAQRCGGKCDSNTMLVEPAGRALALPTPTPTDVRTAPEAQ